MISKNGGSAVSVVICTLNEEKYIGQLLNSLSRQSDRNFEVIVSDGQSEDRTEKIVGSFKRVFKEKGINLRLVSYPKNVPGTQRNRGVKEAKNERILFLDADVVLAVDFLREAVGEIEDRKLDIAQPVNLPMSDYLFDQVLCGVSRAGQRVMAPFWKVAGTQALFSSRRWHQECGGFDESMRLGDDIDYTSRLVKSGARFGILHQAKAYVSMRRLRKEGNMGTLKNVFYHGLLISALGPKRAHKYLHREYGGAMKY